MAAPSSGRETPTSTEKLEKSFHIKLGHSHVWIHTHTYTNIYTHMCTHEYNENTKKASSNKSICPCTPEIPFQFKHQTRCPLEASILLYCSWKLRILGPISHLVLPEVIFWLPSFLWSLLLRGPMYMPCGHSALVILTDGISRTSLGNTLDTETWATAPFWTD